MKKSFFISCVLALSSAGLHAQTIELDIQPTVYKKTYPIGEGEGQVSNIPLPIGEWTTIRGDDYTGSTKGGESYKFREMFLTNVTDGNLNHFLYVKAKVSSTQVKWLDELCKGEDFIYKNDYGAKLWDQRCLTIRQSTFLQKSDNKVQQISRDYLNKNNIKFKLDAIGLSLTQYSRQGKYLVINLTVFPSNYGLENPTAASEVSSPWHLSNYKADPKKVKFIDALKTWAENYSDVLFKSFNEDKKQNVDIPAFAWSAN
jgi:hypothetical protein